MMKYKIKINDQKYLSSLTIKEGNLQCNFNEDESKSMSVCSISLGDIIDLLLTGEGINSVQIEKVLEKPKKQMPKLTETEKVILKSLDKNYKWIVRDKNERLVVFINKPHKDFRYDEWIASCGFDDFIEFPYKDLFKFIKFEDKEPWNIKELLKEANENE